MDGALQFLKDWGTPMFIAAQFVMNVLVLKLTGRFATKKELEDHNTRISDVEGKVTVIESDLRHIPTSDDICGLREDIAGLRSDYKSVSASVKLFNQYLLTESKKGQS